MEWNVCHPWRKGLLLAVTVVGLACRVEGQDESPGDSMSRVIQAQEAGPDLRPLSSIPVPQMTGSDILDSEAAIVLGKAFFWDIQVGSDGQTACASCHFQAGADNRRQHTIHPGPNGSFEMVSGVEQLFSGGNILGDDIVGSQGVVGAVFTGVSPDPAVAADLCTPDLTMPFGSSRRVTGRQSPSVVAAVYFRNNFWDGRASDIFNGLDPFGVNGAGSLRIGEASLASLAVGPPNNEVEMGCAGRPFNGPNSLGSKLLARPVLQFQQISPSDSVLGRYSGFPRSGTRCGNAPCTYSQLIGLAFGETLAQQAEAQFSRIWGQSIQAYLATLIPNQTPYDLFLQGNKHALTANQKRGLSIFRGDKHPGNLCMNCHAGPVLSDASYDFAQRNGLVNVDGGDQGFHNLGVRPTDEDLGRALHSHTGAPADQGAFKTPALRNVKLTAPYMHTGGLATLLEVVNFYDRGGNFDNPEQASAIPPHAGVPGQLGLSEAEKLQLVDFLENGLTDCRTEKEQAPFDHPSLPLPNGPEQPAVGRQGTGSCPAPWAMSKTE
ncbi:MAG TPA: hypothetical protein VEU33_16770 [Archangium sp.]|nr:hypothetical protein [Archangium sp.]